MFRHAEHGKAGDGQLHLTRAMVEATAPGQTVPLHKRNGCGRGKAEVKLNCENIR